jgi:pectate lyase
VVNGMLDVGSVSVGSNKTIIGMDENSGLYGGVVEVDGSNYIFQNLTFGPAGSDVMEISGGTRVFITRCSFHDCGDELLSIVREADYVTVSWCKFYFENTHSHAFAHLIGNSDERVSDRGKLHVTMHHNWYAQGIRSRMPRVRFGHVHIYNNYYNSVNNNYCIGVGVECHIRLENSHFRNVNSIWNDMGGAANGQMGWKNLILEGSIQPTFINNSFPVFDPPYDHHMDPVEHVKSIVTAGAGNVFGGIHSHVPELSITTPPDSSIFPVDSNIVIEVEASIDTGVIEYVSFYADTLLGTDSLPPYSFTWENAAPAIHTLYASATDSNKMKGFSGNIVVFVGSGVQIEKPRDGTRFSVPGDIAITADAWSAIDTVSKVEFYADSSLLGSADSMPYSFIWEDVGPGDYTITARLVEKNDSISISDTVSFSVAGGPEGYEYCSPEQDSCSYKGLYNIAYGADGKFNYRYNVSGTIECSSDVFGDPIPGKVKACWVQAAPTPYVTITSPRYGSIFSVLDDIVINAFAIDNNGTIDSVQFYQNDQLLGVSITEPFTYIWSDPEAGSYNITAVATDNEGNSDTSPLIYIYIRDVTGIHDQDFGDVRLYPSPLSGELIIQLGSKFSAQAEFTLYNSLGLLIMKERLSGAENRLDLGDLEGGIYIVTITSRQETLIRKIIKK